MEPEVVVLWPLRNLGLSHEQRPVPPASHSGALPSPLPADVGSRRSDQFAPRAENPDGLIPAARHRRST